MLSAGLGTASNQLMQEGMSEGARRDLLMEYTDQLRLSIAANLQDYHMQSFQVIPCLQVLCTSICGSWSGLQVVHLPALPCPALLSACLSVCLSVCLSLSAGLPACICISMRNCNSESAHAWTIQYCVTCLDRSLEEEEEEGFYKFLPADR